MVTSRASRVLLFLSTMTRSVILPGGATSPRAPKVAKKDGTVAILLKKPVGTVAPTGMKLPQQSVIRSAGTSGGSVVRRNIKTFPHFSD